MVARYSNFQLIPPDTSNLASVDCFPGEVATGGGIEVDHGALRDMVAITSRPTLGPEDVPNGWDARAYNVDSNGDNAGNIGVRAFAICASP